MGRPEPPRTLETLAWALELSRKGTFPREDYAKFISWVIWHLGGETKNFWPMKMPGPDHQARWMADCIYYLKMYGCSAVFDMTLEERIQCENITEFVIFFYAKAWFQCALAGQAAVSDLTFLCQMHRHYGVSQVWKVLQAFYRQLWYLTGELIPLALLAQGVHSSELEALGRALHSVCRAHVRPRLGKPTFPTITVFLDPYPSAPPLSEFVTSDSFAIFERLGLLGCNVSI